MKTHNCMDCAHMRMGSDPYQGFDIPWPEYCAVKPGVSNLTSWPFKRTTCHKFKPSKRLSTAHDETQLL